MELFVVFFGWFLVSFWLVFGLNISLALSPPLFITMEEWSQIRLCLEAQVHDDFKCAIWCLNNGLLRSMQRCATHNQDRTLVQRQRPKRMQLFWRCSRCRDQLSSRAGSIFFGALISLGQALTLTLCFAHGLSIDEARRALKWSASPETVTQETVVRWYDRVRTRIVQHTSSERKIGGPGVIVQIDEALIGRRKYNRGRVVKGTWVLGMIAEDGNVRFETIENRKACTLERIILKHVERGSIVHTDEWRAYSRLSVLGYEHATVNHSVRFVSPEGVHTQRIESQWRVIRRKFSRGGIHHSNISAHLAEYVWRRSCRINHTDPFTALIQFILVVQ